ncbi:MAG: hypothetical protein OK449_08135 [Thaumarchaeota archaeon]|nr:hypothetical protein [Nitrososphaerota archaeon]
MRGKLILLLLVGAFLCAQPLYTAAAQPSPLSAIELGYSPGSLAPTASGVPVYTAGDALWVMSDSQSPYVIALSNPNGTMVASAPVEPRAPIVLYTFSGSDGRGTWTLAEILLQTGQTVASIPLLVVGHTQVPLNMTEYQLSGAGQLSMNFTTVSSDAYDLLACAVGSATPGTVSIPLPASLGTGDMQVALNGSNVDIVAKAQLNTPFNFWVELHQDYSYTSGATSTVISRDMEVASSTAVPISSSNATSSPITTLLHMRPGRFTLRAFFDSSGGLAAAEAPVLIPSNSTGWISLADCSASSSLPSSSFTLSSTLGSSTQTWPRQVYLMYLEQGVEMYSASQLQVGPAAVDVIAAPWGSHFTDSELAFQLGSDVKESASAGGLIFLTATQYPLTIGLSLLSGETQAVLIPSAYSYVTLQVNSSKVVVTTVVAGAATLGTNLTVSSGNNTISQARSGFGGTAVFYLPQGSYDIGGTFDNVTRTAGVLTVLNNVSAVTLSFPGPGGQGLTYAYVLIGTGAVGLIASALVWAKVYRGRVG